jgi:hypothetical protein
MISSRSLRSAVAALIGLASACSSESSTGPGGTPLSLDQVFGEASLSSLTPITSAFSPVPASATPMPTPSSCTFSAGAFTCPTVTISGVTLTRKFTLYDDHDVVQSQFVSGTTSKVAFESSAHGTVESGLSGFTIDQDQALMLSGLTTGTHLLNGTSRTTITEVVVTGLTTTPATFTVAITFHNLEIPKGNSSYPGSGMMDLAVTSTAGPIPPTHLQLVFNGTSRVAVTVVLTPPPSLHCTLDLASPNPTCI